MASLVDPLSNQTSDEIINENLSDNLINLKEKSDIMMDTSNNLSPMIKNDGKIFNNVNIDNMKAVNICTCPQKCDEKVPLKVRNYMKRYYHALNLQKTKQEDLLLKFIEMKSMPRRLQEDNKRVQCRYKAPVTMKAIEFIFEDDTVSVLSDSEEDQEENRGNGEPKSKKLKLSESMLDDSAHNTKVQLPNDPLIKYTIDKAGTVEVCQKAFMNVFVVAEKRVRAVRERLVQAARIDVERQLLDNLEFDTSYQLAQDLMSGSNPLFDILKAQGGAAQSNGINKNNRKRSLNGSGSRKSLPNSMPNENDFFDSFMSSIDVSTQLLLSAIDKDIELVNTFFYNQLWKPEWIDNGEKIKDENKYLTSRSSLNMSLIDSLLNASATQNDSMEPAVGSKVENDSLNTTDFNDTLTINSINDPLDTTNETTNDMVKSPNNDIQSDIDPLDINDDITVELKTNGGNSDADSMYQNDLEEDTDMAADNDGDDMNGLDLSTKSKPNEEPKTYEESMKSKDKHDKDLKPNGDLDNILNLIKTTRDKSNKQKTSLDYESMINNSYLQELKKQQRQSDKFKNVPPTKYDNDTLTITQSPTSSPALLKQFAQIDTNITNYLDGLESSISITPAVNDPTKKTGLNISNQNSGSSIFKPTTSSSNSSKQNGSTSRQSSSSKQNGTSFSSRQSGNSSSRPAGSSSSSRHSSSNSSRQNGGINQSKAVNGSHFNDLMTSLLQNGGMGMNGLNFDPNFIIAQQYLNNMKELEKTMNLSGASKSMMNSMNLSPLLASQNFLQSMTAMQAMNPLQAISAMQQQQQLQQQSPSRSSSSNKNVLRRSNGHNSNRNRNRPSSGNSNTTKLIQNALTNQLSNGSISITPAAPTSSSKSSRSQLSTNTLNEMLNIPDTISITPTLISK